MHHEGRGTHSNVRVIITLCEAIACVCWSDGACHFEPVGPIGKITGVVRIRADDKVTTGVKLLPIGGCQSRHNRVLSARGERQLLAHNIPETVSV